MRFLKISLAILFTGLFISLFASSPVNAQSTYDSTINPVDELLLRDYYGNQEINVTYNLAHIIQENCSANYYNFFSNVVTSYDDGARWALTNRTQSGNNQSISVYFITNSTDGINFDTNAQAVFSTSANGSEKSLRYYSVDGQKTTMYIDYGGSNQTIRCGYTGGVNIIASQDSTLGNTNRPLVNNFPIEYPDNYNGELIRDELPSPAEPDENLYPQYEYKVQKSSVGMAYHGELTIKYLKNLPYFLTGISTINVSQMTNNWGEIDRTIDSTTINPAGHLGQMDELGVKYSLDELIPGYYMIQITHNQQLDSPPWPENASEKYYVYPVYMQFHWDGQNAVINDNIGCTDVCNPQLDEMNKYERYFNVLGLNVGGLQEVILAPLAFIDQLPRGHENCEPVFLPLPNNIGMIMLPCMTPIYQQHYNSVFVIYQTILTGLFAYYVSIRMFGNVKELANPKDDGIEAVRL